MARVQRQPGGGLAEVIDLIVEKGVMIDAWVKASIVGIEIAASVDTYLRYADAVAPPA
jgi:hypothetical protein